MTSEFAGKILAPHNRGVVLDLVVFLVGILLIRALVIPANALVYAAREDVGARLAIGVFFAALIFIQPVGPVLKRWSFHQRKTFSTDSGAVFTRDYKGAAISAIRVSNDARFVADYRDRAGPVSGVATDGTLAYIVDRPYFRIIDVSKTNSPREIASLFIENIGDRVKVRGNQALIFSRGEVQLIDETGNVWSRGAFSRTGETTLVIPSFSKDRELQMVLCVQRGASVV